MELHSESGAGLKIVLEELWSWVKLKDEELTRQSITGDDNNDNNDVNNLLQEQQVSYWMFMKMTG